jgi:hypothetical protein
MAKHLSIIGLSNLTLVEPSSWLTYCLLALALLAIARESFVVARALRRICRSTSLKPHAKVSRGLTVAAYASLKVAGIGFSLVQRLKTGSMEKAE